MSKDATEYEGLATPCGIEPLPCPFCGHYPKVLVDESGLYDSHIECCNEECEIPSILFCRSVHEAVEKWNKRA